MENGPRQTGCRDPLVFIVMVVVCTSSGQSNLSAITTANAQQKAASSGCHVSTWRFSP
uniref:Uncharacterized protein n=1 Tax=Loigolactobacillus rennini TaxID=238013 RepID=A0A1K2I9F6_9LACO|nr:hypothetical protein LREN565_2120 [Loigolactobacillus rennini]